MIAVARAALAGVVLVVATSSNVRAASVTPELQAVLRVARPDAEIPVILRLPGQLDAMALHGGRRGRARLVRSLRDHARQAQAPLVAAVARSGAKRIRPLWINNSIALRARPDVIRQLTKRADIASIQLDSTMSLPEQTYVPSVTPEWNLQVIGAPALWSLGHAGEGVVVASMDSGVDAAHPDLATRWRGGSNSWFDPSGEHAAPIDPFGHGTQVMGVLVGGDAGGTSIGVAPLARWISAKIFDDTGTAALSGIHLGFQWILDPDGDPDTDDAPDVVNNSWGLQKVNACSTEFADDIAVLRAAEIPVVFAGGNFGPQAGTSVSPANDPGSFAVGATNEGSGVAGMSGRGPSACGDFLYPAVVAPGVNVWTSDLTYGGVIPESYASVTGTSFAAPHVSGAMALLRSAFPSASLNELEAALTATAVDLDPATDGPDNTSGYGLVDVRAAYEHLLALQRVNQPPQAHDDAASTFRTDPVTIHVLANDVDADGELAPASVAIVTGPLAGTAVPNGDGTVTYAPNRSFHGTYAFTYTVADDGGAVSRVATVTVTVARDRGKRPGNAPLPPER
jgi:bacillopeptidase F